jgi:hypothetical protein
MRMRTSDPQHAATSAPLGVMVGLVLAAGVLLPGCMPGAMKVNSESRPQNVDKYVRFRTTYYFRVFGDCLDRSDPSKPLPEIQGLYRFRMTGKASSLTNKVKFESGILPAQSIDPFGKSVTLNGDKSAFIVSDADFEERRKAASELQQLITKLEALNEHLETAVQQKPGSSTSPSAVKDPAAEKFKISQETKAALETAIRNAAKTLEEVLNTPVQAPGQRALDLLKRAYLTLSEVVTATQAAISDPKSGELGKQMADHLKSASAAITKTLARIAEGVVCSNENRGFLVLGPEGWKQFNPDERLIMAMYSSGRPIISTMNELSARALRTDGDPATVSLAYMKEHERIMGAMSSLSDFDQSMPQSAVRAIEGAITKLGGQEK